MRYSADHKERVRSRIVDVASKEFRRRGLDGVGIAELMAKVGLTHGSFYAHFRDRDALVGEATSRAAAQSLERLVKAAQAAEKGRELEAIVDFYLSAEHRDDHACGCLLPALSADMPRQVAAVRAEFTESLKTNLLKLSEFMTGASSKERVEKAMTLMASLVGAVLLARAMSDDVASTMVLKAMRKQLLSQYGAHGRQ